MSNDELYREFNNIITFEMLRIYMQYIYGKILFYNYFVYTTSDSWLPRKSVQLQITNYGMNIQGVFMEVFRVITSTHHVCNY